MRTLGWPIPARIGLAALLLATTPCDPQYHTPQATARDLYAALTTELTGPSGPAPVNVPMPLAALTAAAETIDDRLLALLRLLGPDAVTIDPLLPLRMRDRVAQLPDGQRLAAALVEASRQARTAGPHAARQQGQAGTVEFGRRGTPSNLLPTQLALPADIFAARELSGELVYRLHSGQIQPRLAPTTIILDTTPGTFGPVEALLRLAAHVLVTTLHEYGQEVCLVGLDAPGTAIPLRHPTDISLLWTNRTLNPPDLTTALHTAHANADRTVVALSHHHLIRRNGITASNQLRILTTHTPGDPPRRPPSSRFHLHLPPEADPNRIGRAIATLIEPT